MATITDMLAEHNELAKKHGKMTLNSWKQDKSKLQSRIDALAELDEDDDVPRKQTVRAKVNDGDEPPKKKTTLMQPKPKSKSVDKANELLEKEANRKEEVDNNLTIVQIATDIGMDPKVARAKLRRKGYKSNEGRWAKIERDSKEHKEIVEILKGRIIEE